MKFPNLFRRIRKSLFVFLPLALLAGYAVHDALSHYRGLAFCAVPIQPQPGCSTGASPSDPCHGTTTSSSTVIHIFTPAQIFAGSTDTFRISVSNGAPIDVAAGFDIDVDTPAMLDTVPGMHTFLTAALGFGPFGNWSDITQTKPQTWVGGSDSAVWTFLYTARPTAGFDTIYIDGIAVDGDSASSAPATDHWNQIDTIITVLPAPNIVTPSSSGNLLQVYPNPAANVLFINDGIPTDVGTYTVTDAAGRVVLRGRQIPLDGRQSIDISDIAAGAYVISIQPRMGQAITRRIAIQR
jgi:hypothetical protein